MRLTTTLILGGAILGAARAQEPQLPERGTTELCAKIQRRAQWILPAEEPTVIGTSLAFRDGLGAEFRAGLDGESLRLDTDGDGELETRIDGEDGFVVLQHGDRRYGLRLSAKPQWCFTAGSAMTGKIGDTKIRIIDQNHNGRFDDFGGDAMIVGDGRAASYLSDVIEIDGRLLAIAVSPDGAELSWQPFAGPSGTLALSAMTGGKVLAAVLRSTDGRRSVHLSRADAEVRLPAGDYRLDSGTLALAGSRVQMRTGRSGTITVTADARTELAWGGPARAEFSFMDHGAQLLFDPSQIWYFGAQGEEYYGWNPVGKSPRIAITDDATGKQVAEAWFPGSC